MVKIERQASPYYRVCFLRDIRFIFPVCVSCQEHSQITGQQGCPLYHFHPLHKSFGLQRLHIFERFNDEQGLCKWNQEPYYIFYIIRTIIRVKEEVGFLDLLLNISFQTLIIVVKHSIIKLYGTELLDPPQVFACLES